MVLRFVAHADKAVRAPPDSDYEGATRTVVERLVKFLLWQIGGWKITIAGPREIGDFIARTYSANGARAFDVKLMEQVYERPFAVETTALEKMPHARESSAAL